YGAQARFTLVLRNHIRLELARAANGVGDGGYIQCPQGVDVLLAPRKKLGIDNKAVLDDFGQTRGNFTRRQGFKYVDVDFDCNGLVKSPDHVLAQRVIDPRFAAYRRVDLR